MSPNKVPFEGPEDARIYFVGEAPGADEEEQGRPFVGRAGKFLERYLNRAKLDRSEVRLANLCGYRPPANKFSWLRANKPELLEESIAELLEDIEKTNPNVVVPLGAWPMYYLTGCSNAKGEPGSGIGLWRGSVVPCSHNESRKALITYHPAYVIRPQGFKWHPIFANDLARAVKHSKTTNFLVPQFDTYIDPPEDVLNQLVTEMSAAEWLSVDIENFPGELSCIGFADSDKRALVLTFERMHINWPAAEALLSSPAAKILQNGRYDVDFLWHYYQWPTNNFKHDTLVASASLLPEFPRALDFLCSIYTEFRYYKSERKEWKQSGDLDILWNYNAKDVIATYQIAMQQRKELEDVFGFAN